MLISQDGRGAPYAYLPNSQKDFLTPNEWQQIALVFDGDYLRYYKNGSEELVSDVSFSHVYDSTANLLIGAYMPGDLRGLVGYLDEFYLYNVALDTAQISELYNYVSTEKYAITVIPEPFTIFLLVSSLFVFFLRSKNTA